MRDRAVVRYLKDVRAELAKPYGWCKGALHRRPFLGGRIVEQYCMLGQLNQSRLTMHINRLTAIRGREVVEQVLVNRTGKRHIATFNDAKSTRKRDVLAVLDEAIDRAEA